MNTDTGDLHVGELAVLEAAARGEPIDPLTQPEYQRLVLLAREERVAALAELRSGSLPKEEFRAKRRAITAREADVRAQAAACQVCGVPMAGSGICSRCLAPGRDQIARTGKLAPRHERRRKGGSRNKAGR